MAGEVEHMANVTVRDVRKSVQSDNSWEKGVEIKGDVIKHTIYNDQLFLNLDTGYEIGIALSAIKDAISEIVSKEVLERLKGRV